MLGNLGNMANVMKMAKDMQGNLKKAQDEMKDLEAVGQAADGKIEVVAAGDFSIKRINIDPECLKSIDAEVLADMITVAANQALSEVKGKAKDQLSSITGGMNIPGLFS